MTRKQAMVNAKQFEGTDAGRACRKLLEVVISDLREKNDTATTEDFLKNQGAIRELKLMHKGIGPKQTMTEFDGGFGD